MILYTNPKAQYEACQAEINSAIQRVLQSGWYLLGQELKALETEFASFVGATHGVWVASGTDALRLALIACGIGPGAEVITVSHTSVATVAAIELVGATPVLVDIEPDYYTLNPEWLSAAVTPRTKAILPVHLYGQPANMDAVLDFARNRGLRVIEDCAQGHGATWRNQHVGTLGDAGGFSFYPTKNLGALGDAGMVVTQEESVAVKVRHLREYGWDGHRISQFPGCNSRLDEIQAAVLRAKLPHLAGDNEARLRMAQFYDTALRETPLVLPRVRNGARHVYHLYVVRAPKRDQLRQFLKEQGVLAGIHYPTPVHWHPAYRGRIACSPTMAVTEQIASETLSLPIYPQLSEAEAQMVVDAVREFYV